MTLDALNAISPVDGRYRDKCRNLAGYFSEGALIRYRIRVEIEYFIALCRLPLPQLRSVSPRHFRRLRALYENPDRAAWRRVKRIEKTTNHDVKAVEYYLQERFQAMGLGRYTGFIHFGLTSQDINNTAVPLSLREALAAEYSPLLDTLEKRLRQLARQWRTVPMLAHTHGQPASPTRLGKEMMVFVDRIAAQRKLLAQVPFSAKFGGATGNFNAHAAAYPKRDWPAFADRFIRSMRLQRLRHTTQIDHYDNLAALFDGIKRINTVLLDLSRDMWMYIALNYFRQTIRAGETGSSTMPHKVNPIDFENAEGNLGVANALFEHLAAKLPVSRMQRDLSDSTVLRTVGVPVAHTVLAMQSLLKGLSKVHADRDTMRRDLEKNWAVVAEGIQTILRREGVPGAYEQLKKLTRRNEAPGKKEIDAFIDELGVDDGVRKELRALTPYNYTGVYKP